MSDQTPQTSGAQEPAKVLSPAATVAAFLCFAGFAAFVVYLITQADAPQREWKNLVYVFGAVEAIAFAGLGALFGTKIERAQTAKAEQRAAANEKDAKNGRAIAESVKTDPGKVQLEGGAQPTAAVLVQHYSEMAHRLFPD